MPSIITMSDQYRVAKARADLAVTTDKLIRELDNILERFGPWPKKKTTTTQDWFPAC